ncbi:MAG: hypothetical protein ABW352_17885, partial [Polyangiales bacterium]
AGRQGKDASSSGSQGSRVDAGTSAESDAGAARDAGPQKSDAGSADAGQSPVEMGDGTCCDDGNCLCRGPEPTAELLKKNGSYKVADYDSGFKDGPTYLGAKVWYPSDATAPFSAIVLCPGLTGVIRDLAPWGPFLASHGIVTMVIDTNNPNVDVAERAVALMEAFEALKAENTRDGSPLQGKLTKDRYGMGGWSMGGGATWINTSKSADIKTGMTLAGHNTTAGGASIANKVMAPTIIFAGSADPGILGGSMQSQNAYKAIPATTPKLLYEVSGGGHWDYNTPVTNMNMIGYYGLAFQKTFLEGDERYRKFLLDKGPNASDWQSNIE